MRLIRIPDAEDGDSLPELVDFPPDKVPEYAILSHRWGAPADEVLFEDMTQPERHRKENLPAKKGYEKLQYSYKQALQHRLSYIWIDTCCIDKSSSAELSEAINSMYAWYRDATVCYVYLDDVATELDSQDGTIEDMQTLWVTRGWTLQELLAPSNVMFYSANWAYLGTKYSLSSILAKMTGINEDFLIGRKPVRAASVATRMSWAAHRKTTRPEDMAYCLMGIFLVNMPMLYGEGARAFLRLQEEIMKACDDHSLFAWVDEAASRDSYHGLLAKHPGLFNSSAQIFPYQEGETREPYSMTNRGLRIELHLALVQEGTQIYAAALDCPTPLRLENLQYLTIILKKLSGVSNQYARVQAMHLGQIGHEKRGKLETIYVRQDALIPDPTGIYPLHVFCFPSHGEIRAAKEYQVRDMFSSGERVMTPKLLEMGGLSAAQWHERSQVYEIIHKVDQGIICVLYIGWKHSEDFLILVGYRPHQQLGFCIVDPHAHNIDIWSQQSSTSYESSFPSMLTPFFWPRPMGSRQLFGRNLIHVIEETSVEGVIKCHLIDITIERK
ncbi:hypothetical protein MMC25_006249 [Agyrium rufum]|nr:hypothetical protein [Agyrium rufum]